MMTVAFLYAHRFQSICNLTGATEQAIIGYENLFTLFA